MFLRFLRRRPSAHHQDAGGVLAWISWGVMEAWTPDTGPSLAASAHLSEAEARALLDADLARYGEGP